jgi:hypothetical protein
MMATAPPGPLLRGPTSSLCDGMRRVTCLAVMAGVWLVACGPGGAHNPVSQSTANAAALAAIKQLEQYRASSSSTAIVTGFTVVTSSLTSDTAAVSDAQGDVLTVSPAPSQAWVVEITAPPQGIWGSISALAEVDSASGVVAGTGLWAIPANAPVKPG